MKSLFKASTLFLVIFCSVSIASASSQYHAARNNGSANRVTRIFSITNAQRSASFILLSSSQASNFGRHLTLGDRTLRAGQLVLGLSDYTRSSHPAHLDGFWAFVDGNGTAAVRSAGASLERMVGSLPDSEPNLLFLLGICLMGSSLLVLRSRRTA